MLRKLKEPLGLCWNLMEMNCFDDFDDSNEFRMCFCVGLKWSQVHGIIKSNLEQIYVLRVKKVKELV